MTKKAQFLSIFSLLVMILVLWGQLPIQAAFHQRGDLLYEVYQPDGSKFTVTVFGDEYYRVVESLEGYVLIKDAAEWIYYAQLNHDRSEFVTSGILFRGNAQTDGAAGAGIDKYLQITPQSRQRKAMERLMELEEDSFGMDLIRHGKPVERAMVGDVVGLTIIIDFSDQAATIPKATVVDYCNKPGFNEFSNNGSVYDYFYEVSGQKLKYTNIVYGYYRAKNPKSYYDDCAAGKPKTLLTEALTAMDAAGFNFAQLTTNSSKQVLACNVYYAGTCSCPWAQGLWPHSGSNSFQTNDGVSIYRYQMTDMKTALSIGTFCHENGHMLCGYPDLYDYGYESKGVGKFCLMCSQDSKNPQPPCAPLRDYYTGWEELTDITNTASGTMLTDLVNDVKSFKYRNVSNSKECFYLEARRKTGRSTVLPAEGLLIWHFDANGSNDYEDMTPTKHYRVSLEQADGKFDLEKNVNSGQLVDAYYSGNKTSFTDSTVPDSKWWPGTVSGLKINNVSVIGNSMTFLLGDQVSLTADFDYSTQNTSAIFTDKSTGNIGSWQWTFIKNGSTAGTSTVQNPTFNYSQFGLFQAKLVVSDQQTPPQTATVTKNILIEDVPPAPCPSAGDDFSYFWITKTGLGNLNNSSAASGYTDYTKTVAAPELKQNQTYTLNMNLNTAQYTNWFKAYIDYNRDGDFADAGEVIYVSPEAQKIEAINAAVIVPATAALGITRLRVQVKNATSTNLPAPEPCENFAYGEVEDYYVKIIPDDCQPPTANFSFSVNQCTAAFTNTSTSAAPIVSYNWNFGNGSTSTLQNPSCTYAGNGTYSVSLTVTNNCGKSATISKQVIISNCSQNTYDHLVGSFPGIGIWLRDSQTTAWTQLSKQQADIIRVGDVNGNGQDDMAAFFKATEKLWYRYDNGIWEDIPASAATLIAFDLGDMNNDGRKDLVGSWSDKGLWWRNNANGVWTKLSSLIPSLVAAGDFDGDNKADVVGLFPSLNSIWIYYSNNTWKQISKQINLNDLRAGNMDNDTKAELVGSWDIGVWMFDPETNLWVKHHANQAKQIAVGDINAGGMQDIVGYWNTDTPLHVKYLENNTWQKLSNYNPDTLDAGKLK